MVLIFCVEFQELSHLTRDLSQAENKSRVKWDNSQNSTQKMRTYNLLLNGVNNIQATVYNGARTVVVLFTVCNYMVCKKKTKPERIYNSGNVYLLLSSWKVNIAENPIAIMGL